MVSLALDTPELAEEYDVVGRRQYECGKQLIEDLGVAAGQRVLDIGCGTGLLGAYVAGVVGPRGQVVGIDPLPFRIALARKKAPRRFEASVGQAEDLSAYSPGSFDVVYLNFVLHWLPDKGAVLRAIHRVLEVGGLVGFTMLAKEKPLLLEQACQRALAASGLAESPTAALMPYRANSEEVRELFVSTGFKTKQLVIRVRTDHFDNVDEVLTFVSASSFGNHLSELTAAERGRVRDAFAVELEVYRDSQGIRLERSFIFAVAQKVADDRDGAGPVSGPEPRGVPSKRAVNRKGERSQ
jgi:arsenite methyltransferase